MTIKILTIFPHFYDQFLDSSIVKRAIAKGVVRFEIINIRDYSLDKNHRVDDHPIGGGAGLVMRLEPLVSCLRDHSSEKTHKIFMGPRGKKYSQADAIRLSKMDEILLVCGHYEGVDSRFLDYVDEELSLGDFILTGGEIPAMAVADSVTRLLKGAISDDSTKEESFDNNLLEYDQYTYPIEFEGKRIPDILFCGNHEAVEEFRHRESLRITREKRPDLLDKMFYTRKDYEYLRELATGKRTETSREKEALKKGSRFVPEK